jgi:hypothetical protein
MTENIALKKAMFEDLGYHDYEWNDRSTWVDELIEKLISEGWTKKI